MLIRSFSYLSVSVSYHHLNLVFWVWHFDILIYCFGDSAAFFCRDELVEKGNGRVSSVWSESWMATKAVIKIPTFHIIVLQGIIGSLPWTAMVFFTMWFELIGTQILTHFIVSF